MEAWFYPAGAEFSSLIDRIVRAVDSPRDARAILQATRLPLQPEAWHEFSSISGPMANPQLDQFTQALIWKAVPPIILAGIAGILLREGLQWLERKATAAGRSRRARREAGAGASTQTLSASTAAPHCPMCNALMAKRTAKRGARAGLSFWGCPNYPKCHGTRES